MNDDELLRYSRQIMLPGMDYEGQEKLKQARVLLIGLGGLGSPIALYLASAGIGQLVLCDFDQVELSNLQRQIIHSTESIGKDKVSSACEHLTAINPLIDIITLNHKLSSQELETELQQADIVLDASDNFETRFLINRLSHKHKIPLISGAAIRYEGQISVFNQTENSPCYHCLYQDDGSELDLSCSANGVLGPVLGIIGSMQAMEAIKLITGIGQSLDGRLLIFDAKHTEWRQLKLKKDPACTVCSS